MALGHVQLTPQLVQAVRDAVDVVALASEHTRLKRSGRRYTGLCPLHKEKTPSFSVDPARGLFYCFGCGVGGDAIKLHQLTTGDDFPSAIESLAQRHGIPLPTARRRPQEALGPDLTPVLGAAAEFFSVQLKGAREPQSYLERRRIPVHLVEEYGLGYAPAGWRHLISALHPRFPLSDLEAAGLVAASERQPGEHYDRFRHRLMFPIRDASGRLVGFGGRTLGDDRAKYLNTRETDQFHKGSLLYGLDRAKRAIRDTARALLVEGYFDVLGSVAAGLEGTVASMGTALTAQQARLLRRHGDEVVVGYDGDEAGEAAFRRALPLLLGEGLTVRRARLPAGSDPDSLRLRGGAEALVERIEGAQDAVEMELERLLPPDSRRTPPERARLARRVGELLRPIPDPVLRYSYGRLAAERLGVPVELLWSRVTEGQEPRPGHLERRGKRGPKLVFSHEEAVLETLLRSLPESSEGETSGELPSPEELPPPEVFLDPGCRNTFEVFSALYKGEGRPPSKSQLLARLAGQAQALDEVARILIEDPAVSRPIDVLESLERLRRRWRRQRRGELQRAIDEAQRAGDNLLLEELVRDWSQLVQEIHGRPPKG